MTYISLRIPDDLLENVQRRAEIEDRSLSAVVRQSLRRYVAEHDQEQANDRERTAA